MNTFRTIFHMLVVVMIVFIGNVTAKGIFETLTKKLENISTGDAKSMGLGAMSTAGGLILVEQLHKKNPVAIALTSAAFGCTVGQSAEAGLAAGATSIAISGMDYCLSDNIKRDLSGNLPKCLTSEGAKITAQILIATTVGYYFGKEAQG